MKAKIIALLLGLLVAGCLPKKKSDIEPDLAGTYQVSQISDGSTTANLPDGRGTSATAVVVRPSDSQIQVTVNVMENGQNSPADFGTLSIQKASGRDYDVLNPNTRARIGSINGTDFTLDFSGNGQRFVLISRK